MLNPLNKRIKRDILHNKGRYISIFILLSFTIAVVSAFFIVQKSVKYTYDRASENSRLEDARIEFEKKLSKEDEEIFYNKNLNFVENFSINTRLEEYDSKVNKGNENKNLTIYKNRRKINKLGIYEGRLPKKDNEILLERLFAKNNKIFINSEVKFAKKKFKVVGIGAFSDYSTLLRKNDDIIMDNKNFGLGIISDRAFDNLETKGVPIKYIYSYRINGNKKTIKQETDILTDISKKFIKRGKLPVNGIIKSSNKNISYFIDDMGGDIPMILTLFTIILLVMAFVFTVLVSGMIEDEAAVIGTLLASGYKKIELIKHYMLLPILITIFSGIVGNILAYTLLKDYYLDLYYSSYSLFPVIMQVDLYAFVITTLVPIFMVFVINLFYISLKMQISPLRFLKKELSRKVYKKAVRLPQIDFISRYRIRIFLKNKSNYLVLMLGILLGNILLIFGLGLNPMFESYVSDIEKSMPSNYQVIFKGPIENEIKIRKSHQIKRLDKNSLDNPSYGEENSFFAEATKLDKENISLFTTLILESEQPIMKDKLDIQIYGTDLKWKRLKGVYDEKSSEGKYNNVYLSKGLSKRLKKNRGDFILLYDKYRDKNYRVKVAGITDDFSSSLVIMMDRKKLNELIDKEKSYYNGVFTDQKPNVFDKEVASVIGKDEMTKIGRQFLRNFKGVGGLVTSLSIVIFLVLMYVLTKIVIDKYKEQISYLRIFGYSDSEINKIFIRVSTIAIVVFSIVLTPVEKILVEKSMNLAMLKMNGYINVVVSTKLLLYSIFAVLVSYMLVRMFLLRKIRKIDMSEALKDRN